MRDTVPGMFFLQSIILIRFFFFFLRMPGDKRSFAMVKIAAHRLAGEKRKGWAVVNVVAEMCEALVSQDAIIFPFFLFLVSLTTLL